MINIVEKLDASISAKRKIFPCNTNRASALGDACLRKLVYMRTNWKDASLPELSLQYIFEEGKSQEDKVVRALLDAGVLLIRLQQSFEVKEGTAVLFTAHVDGFVLDESTNEEFPVEIKSMNPFIWDKMETVEDFKRYPWTSKYKDQLIIYIAASGAKEGAFLLVNKSTGRVKQINIQADPARFHELKAKALTINQHVVDGTFPDRIPLHECEGERCPFFTLCGPDVEFSGSKFVYNAELDAKIRRREELKEAADEYKEVDEDVKAQIKESIEEGASGKIRLLLGEDYEANLSKISRATVTIQGYSYWDIRIKRTKKAVK